MQKANIALISTLYNTRGADFYKDIYFIKILLGVNTWLQQYGWFLYLIPF